MFTGLLGFVGLGAAVVCGKDVVEERNQHLASLVQRVEQVSHEHQQKAMEYPFAIKGKRIRLDDKWPSPIYSRFRNGVCEIILNDNEDTHLGYEELMTRVQNEKPKMLESAEFYVVGHEVGHCVYKYLKANNPDKVSVVFKRDTMHEVQHPDDEAYRAPPREIGIKERRLHEEIFADVYGIEFSRRWLGEEAKGLDDVVVRFRQKVSAHDPNYYTQHYIKSCLDGDIQFMDRLHEDEAVDGVTGNKS